MIREGTKVQWKWGPGYAQGTVTERHEDSVTRTVDGTEIVRHGTEDDAAFVIEQSDGQTVLKLESELERLDA